MSAEQEWFETNRAMWDERVPIPLRSAFYDVEGFKAGTRDHLRPFVIDEVGDVRGKDLVHLQCHFGQNTLSWARRGANVTGLDFSGPAIEAARALASECGIDATFVHANVYDAPEALGGRQFDIAYVDVGAIVWLPDIRRWAEVVAAVTRPGGILYMLEGHPLHGVFADHTLDITQDYFQAEPFAWDDEGTYADANAVTTHNRSYEWSHPLGEVVSAIVAAGLQVEFLHEFPFAAWQRWPFLVRNENGEYHFPPGMPRIPLMYSLRARKPA